MAQFFFKKHSEERSEIAKKNIFYSFFVKGFGIFISLLLVPVTIKFLNPTEYGIWLTLNSILLWINTFDIGLGNGLRNKLSEALADNDLIRAKHYISTAYCTISVLMIIIFIFFYCFNFFINWYKILNVDEILVPNLNNIIFMAFGFFCLSFVLKLIGNILLAMHKSAIENLLIMLAQFLSLIIIASFSFFSKGTLWLVAFVYSISPVIVYLCAYPFVFRGKYKIILPSIKYFRKSDLKLIMSLGMQFFVLQISALVIFSTSNLIISNKFGPQIVTDYNIAFRYFNVIPLLFTIVLTPIWSATTDAYRKGDKEWILTSLKKIRLLLFITFFLLLIMVFISTFVYKVWVGDDINIPLKLSVIIAIYIFVLVCSLSYSSFINGIGKLRVQMINIFICSIFYLPVTFFLANKIGIYGVVLSLILVNLSGLLLNIIQFNYLLNDKAKGIWNK